MARPREFDEEAVLDAAMQRFWDGGYEATSVKDLTAETGLTAASLYNAFGDKRAIYRTALDRYIETSIGVRIGRCEALPPRAAIATFFGDVLRRSLSDRQHKGCMVVNAALELAPHDGELRDIIAGVLKRIEAFFRSAIEEGQADGTIGSKAPAEAMAQHLLGVLMGLRVLARVRPERALLEGLVATALAGLGDGTNGVSGQSNGRFD